MEDQETNRLFLFADVDPAGIGFITVVLVQDLKQLIMRNMLHYVGAKIILILIIILLEMME